MKKLIRDLHKVMDDDLITNFCDQKVSVTDDLDLAVSSFNDELKWVLDIVAPEKEKVISMRKLLIWYDKAIREQHCIVKKHEYGRNTEKTISGKPIKWKGIITITLFNQRKETTYDQK